MGRIRTASDTQYENSLSRDENVANLRIPGNKLYYLLDTGSSYVGRNVNSARIFYLPIKTYVRYSTLTVRRKRKNHPERGTQQKLTSFIPSSLPRLLVPRRGGNAISCHPPLQLLICNVCSEELSPRALLLLLRLSNRCLALDFLTGAAGSSSGSLCTSQRDGDLKRLRGLAGEVTGEVSLCTRVPNIVIIRPRLYGRRNRRRAKASPSEGCARP